MNAAERARLRDQVTRARLQITQSDVPVEMDPEVRKAYAWSNEILDRYAPKGRVGKCVYCGGPAVKQRYPRTCPGHEDLPAADPAFEAELQLRGVA